MLRYRKDLCLDDSVLPVHKQLTATFGQKRVYTIGLLMVNCLPARDREKLMSFVGRGRCDTGKIKKAVRKLLRQKE